jgi:hypothetical protein
MLEVNHTQESDAKTVPGKIMKFTQLKQLQEPFQTKEPDDE